MPLRRQNFVICKKLCNFLKFFPSSFRLTNLPTSSRPNAPRPKRTTVPDSWWRGRIKSWKLNSRRWRTKSNPNLSPPSLLLRPKWHNWRNNLTRRTGKSFIISNDFKLGCVDPTKGWQGGPQKVNWNLKSCENKLWIYTNPHDGLLEVKALRTWLYVIISSFHLVWCCLFVTDVSF